MGGTFDIGFFTFPAALEALSGNNFWSAIYSGYVQRIFYKAINSVATLTLLLVQARAGAYR